MFFPTSILHRMLVLAVGGIALTSSGRLPVAASPSSQLAAAEGDKGPIKIGFITSLSGVAAGAGQDMADGIQLYMDQIHNRMAGRQVKLIIENDASSPATALGRLQKLVNEDKVQIVDGILLANISAAVVPVAERDQIPMVGAVCTSDDLTQRQQLKWFIRTGYSSSQPMHPFGEYVYKTLGYKRVAMMVSDYTFGYEQSGGFQKSFEEAGGKVVQKVWAPLGFMDFTSQIKSLTKDADAVYLISIGSQAAIVPKQYKEFGPGLPVIGSGSSYDEFILPKLGDEAVGAISPLIYSAMLDFPANKKFVAAYRAKYHRDPSYYAECSYTSGMWINKAIEALKGNVDDKAKVMAALRQVELKDTPRGPVRLDEHGNAVCNVYFRRVDRVNGKLQNTVVGTVPMVSQFWKWKPELYLKNPPYSKEYPPCTHCAIKP